MRKVSFYDWCTNNNRQEYEYQQWKDEYKKQYALNSGYGYIAIPYYDIDNGNYIKIINEQISLLKP